MKYILKEKSANLIKNKYKNSYFIDKLDLTGTYVSLILNRKKPVAKRLAFAITKAINSNSDIEDIFEVVN